jgi:F-type H+-transporting ATPase subunit delta
MAELKTIARPYAEAAFALARDANALPAWLSLLRFASAVIADPKMYGALDNPKFTAADKETLLLSVLAPELTRAGLDKDGRNFIRVLVEADRVALLPYVAELFETLKNEAEGVARAQIASAFPLDEAEVADLKVALEHRFGKKIEATVTVDPELIGGARIVVGDRVIDASVQGQLAAMATHLRA